jgi:hypothetical protein
MIFILSIIGRIIDEPSVPDAMEFGRPDGVPVPAAGRGIPDAHSRIVADADDRF